MKTFYLPHNYRLHWQRPTQYRPRVGVTEYPRCLVVWLGWLVIEATWYGATPEGIVI